MESQLSSVETAANTTEQSIVRTLIPTEAGTPEYSSESLFQGRREVLISHEGQTYRLRVTRGGKLILNK